MKSNQTKQRKSPKTKSGEEKELYVYFCVWINVYNVYQHIFYADSFNSPSPPPLPSLLCKIFGISSALYNESNEKLLGQSIIITQWSINYYHNIVKCHHNIMHYMYYHNIMKYKHNVLIVCLGVFGPTGTFFIILRRLHYQLRASNFDL